ncbi:hypothetical protein IU440_20885 [Nocardia cyriacigeorgica]|uniref:hypothetical protein n=1 Tax=Nocardia cyriacigeorgica TaxID=135487 RepID=UPI001893712D|nr:hypothetical protein [Nocardia cyriacigeorgica]MBF6289053.1 hypothetical protein [Nocardia cyriacigeorgica]MBF6427143.1 hypothetical protein [Nocardia cyriacigeorgica]
MSTTDPKPSRSDEPALQAERRAVMASDSAPSLATGAPTRTADTTHAIDSSTDEAAGATRDDDAPDSGKPGKRTSNSAGTRSSARRTRIAWAAWAAVLIGALGAAAYFAVRAEQVQSRADATEAARLAACEYAPVLADYNAHNLDTYFAAVLDGATGDWKQEFDATSKDLREVLVQGQVVSKPGEVQCAIESGDEHSARAVVVIGQSISSVGTNGQPREGQLAVTLSMQNVEGSWLVSEVSSPLLPQ